MFRTHNCGELNIKNQNQIVTLSGWIKKIRKIGSIKFIDLRDMYGITQIIITKKMKFFNTKLYQEYVIKITGIVKSRLAINKKLNTGEIEIIVKNLKIINKSKNLPFLIDDNTDATELLRMKYRYLDIRRNIIKNIIINRSHLCNISRKFFIKNNFIEIETPILIKSTPEGARDFVVPSRKRKGKFYSLPQSPQLFKQMLMIGGIDKYFQIAKCFRDEDFRSNRQPEFTQIDCEMAFVNQKDIMNMCESYLNFIFKSIKNINISKSWKTLTYKESIEKYGTDKPDIRFKMKILNISNENSLKKYKFFTSKDAALVIKIKKNIYINNITNILNCIKKIKKVNFNENIIYIEYVKTSINYYLISNKVIYKDYYINEEDIKKWLNIANVTHNDITLIILGDKNIIRKKISKLRLKIAKESKMHDNTISPLWIIDFPWIKLNDNKYKAVHHPFTAPKIEDIKKYQIKNPIKITSQSYDIVINGQEIGGGSIRIHDKKIQKLMFHYLGLTKEEYTKQFGFFIKAFNYGAPPHGGLAIGLDRLMKILYDNNKNYNIKEYIPFPKNKYGEDLMTNSPNNIDSNILNDLKIKIEK